MKRVMRIAGVRGRAARIRNVCLKAPGRVIKIALRSERDPTLGWKVTAARSRPSYKVACDARQARDFSGVERNTQHGIRLGLQPHVRRRSLGRLVSGRPLSACRLTRSSQGTFFLARGPCRASLFRSRGARFYRGLPSILMALWTVGTSREPPKRIADTWEIVSRSATVRS